MKKTAHGIAEDFLRLALAFGNIERRAIFAHDAVPDGARAVAPD
jgi:hypothetical protein